MLLLMFNQFDLMIFRIVSSSLCCMHSRRSDFPFTFRLDFGNRNSFRVFSFLSNSLFIKFSDGFELVFTFSMRLLCVFFCYCLLLKCFVSIVVTQLIFLWCWNYFFFISYFFAWWKGGKIQIHNRPQQREKLNVYYTIDVLGSHIHNNFVDYI